VNDNPTLGGKKMKLVSMNSDAKTVKGLSKNYLTGIVYLAPAKISGVELCRYRSKGCTAACLYTAGRGAFTTTQTARIRRAQLFNSDREQFYRLLVKGIQELIQKANRQNLTPVVRLNGTSDIDYPTIFPNLFQEFSSTQFYDYTKDLKRFRRPIPENYHLTFSRSEVNGLRCLEVLEQRLANVAVVFAGKRLPARWNGFPVFNADETDLRFADPGPGMVAGLLAKGAAKKDFTGFVVH